MTEKENKTKDLKFYSQTAIVIGTFIGGPLASGYLIKKNYLSLNKADEGKKSLIIGIISSILLFLGILMTPDSIMDKIPSQILPAIYTTIVYVIVEKKLGPILNLHKENGNEFHSIWRAVGIGFISLIILLIGIFGYSYLSSDTYEYKKYNAKIVEFTKNETESIVFYDHIDTETNNSLIKELDKKTIPYWEENIEIIKESNNIKNLPSELLEQNKTLLKYSELRLKAFELYKKAIIENTSIYQAEIEKIHIEIDEQLKKLN